MSKRKLTEEDVKKIRHLHHKGATLRAMAEQFSMKNIAKEFGVSPTTIHGVVYYYSYNNVD